MSEATESRTIPVGILVSVGDARRKKRSQPVRVPRAHRPTAPRIPWPTIVLASVGVWIAGLGVVACWAGRPEPQVAEAPPTALEPMAVEPIAVEPVAVVALPAAAVIPALPAAPVALPLPVVEVPAALAVPEPPVVAMIEPRPVVKVNATIPEPEVEPALANVPMPEPQPEPVIPADPVKPAACATNLGTTIAFVADPVEAFQKAKKEKKLVFMIHLSGNFEDKEFT